MRTLRRSLSVTIFFGLVGFQGLGSQTADAGAEAVARSALEAFPKTGCCSVEQLAAATSLPIGGLLAVLTDMEVRGLIRSMGSQRYERA